MEKSTAAASDARQITSALRRVHKTISSTVTNADEAVSVLLQDGAILEDTLQDHKYGLKSTLQTTKYRLDRIKSAETRETYSIFLSLSFFTAVVVYIIAKRTRLLTVAWLAINGVIRGRNFISLMSAKVSDIEEVSVLDLLSNKISGDHEGYQMPLPLHASPDTDKQQAGNPIDVLTSLTTVSIEGNVEGNAYIREPTNGETNLLEASMKECSDLDTDSRVEMHSRSEGNDEDTEIDLDRASASDYLFI